jgi:8-oxo-dGTP pyrophosphatase MutT (NUDIX family)
VPTPSPLHANRRAANATRARPLSKISVVPVERLDLGYVCRPWVFAAANRSAIDDHFSGLQRRNPALWNGKVLMLGAFSIAEGAFRGSYFPVDYASFIAWRDWNYPDPNAHDCFAMGTIRSADGAFLLGVMAPSTANSGLIYFPCGTPDLSDVTGDKVALEANVERELAEETGLRISEFDVSPGWLTVLAGPWIANMKMLSAREDATTLRTRILDHLAGQRRPELSDIRIVRGPLDLSPMMPPHVVAYLQYVWHRDKVGANGKD